MELSREDEGREGEEASHLYSWWKNRNTFATCLLCLLRGNGETRGW